MKRREPALAILIVLLGMLATLAVLGRPADLWFTEDQQADRLAADEKYAAAAELYTDPMRQGVAYFRGGGFEAAAGAFARVDGPEAAFNRGNVLVMLGKYDDAIASYDRALQFQPDWTAAQENRAIAAARRDKMKPPDDDAGGTGGQLEADEIVFDDRANKSSQTEEIEVGAGEQMSDGELRELWLHGVQTKPGDFLRNKFAYQLSRRGNDEAMQDED